MLNVLGRSVKRSVDIQKGEGWIWNGEEFGGVKMAWKEPNWSEHNENVSKYQVSVDDELVRDLI